MTEPQRLHRLRTAEREVRELTEKLQRAEQRVRTLSRTLDGKCRLCDEASQGIIGLKYELRQKHGCL